MKKVSIILLVTAVIAGMYSCHKKTVYSPIPAITFKQMIHYTPGDSLDIEMNFTDGDGDIGYQTSDTTAPFNCYLIPYRDSAGGLIPIRSLALNDPVTGDTVVYKYHIPYITPDGSDKSLNGLIKVMLKRSVWDPTSFPFSGQQIAFRIWILDRALHKSNRITTTLTLCP